MGRSKRWPACSLLLSMPRNGELRPVTLPPELYFKTTMGIKFDGIRTFVWILVWILPNLLNYAALIMMLIVEMPFILFLLVQIGLGLPLYMAPFLFFFFFNACIMKNKKIRLFLLKNHRIQCQKLLYSETYYFNNQMRQRNIYCRTHWEPTDEERDIVEQFFRERPLTGSFLFGFINFTVIAFISVGIPLICIIQNLSEANS